MARSIKCFYSNVHLTVHHDHVKLKYILISGSTLRGLLIEMESGASYSDGVTLFRVKDILKRHNEKLDVSFL